VIVIALNLLVRSPPRLSPHPPRHPV